MNINELFEVFQNEELLVDLNGELSLEDNAIVWSYELTEDVNEIEEEVNEIEESEEELLDFEDSNEETLLDVYDTDLETIEQFLAEMDDYTEWTFSEPEVTENKVSFRIS